MVTLNEDFKPDGKYTGYLLLATLALIVVIWAACCAWMFVDSIFTILIVIGLAVLGVCVVFACIWAPLYYKSVVYHLNDTEMTWKRGVFFRKTGIVPYNRIIPCTWRRGRCTDPRSRCCPRYPRTRGGSDRRYPP